jgi:hypothetical protein
LKTTIEVCIWLGVILFAIYRIVDWYQISRNMKLRRLEGKYIESRKVFKQATKEQRKSAQKVRKGARRLARLQRKSRRAIRRAQKK